MSFLHYLSFLDLRSYRLSSLRKDFTASVTVSFLDIPQGIAYAMIAGLPPVMGLYAAAVPAIIGALCRSSHHVVTGPTNALSLLVGSAVAAEVARSGATPMEVGVTLALGVGVLQMLAGVLRLDAFVDFLSQPVIRGYITGAATLIIAGQLANVTGTPSASGDPLYTLMTWSRSLPHTNGIAVTFALSTVGIIIGLRRLGRHWPGAIIATVLSILIALIFPLHEHGLRLVSDLSPIPAGLPPFTVPQLALWSSLAPAALACAVLSLVESSSVARDLATRSGQRLDMAAEFFGQGTANTAAAFFGGYPISGSLGRSALNQQAGAESRLAAVLCGSLTILVLLFLGPLVGHTPVASLAGLLLVLANDLIDRDRIKRILRGTLADRAGFLFTLLGTWTLPLDRAIYLGVGISIVLFLRRARLLSAREMAIGEKGRFREVESGAHETADICPAIRILNLAGPLFFAVVGELERALDPFVHDKSVRVLIVRLRQAENADITTVSILEATAQKLASEGRTLILLGLRRGALTLLEQTGLAQGIGRENMFLAQAGWFTAMESALQRALTLTGAHTCGGNCPLAKYLTDQQELRATHAAASFV